MTAIVERLQELKSLQVVYLHLSDWLVMGTKLELEFMGWENKSCGLSRTQSGHGQDEGSRCRALLRFD